MLQVAVAANCLQAWKFLQICPVSNSREATRCSPAVSVGSRLKDPSINKEINL
jgi:hypothetical protein